MSPRKWWSSPLLVTGPYEAGIGEALGPLKHLTATLAKSFVLQCLKMVFMQPQAEKTRLQGELCFTILAAARVQCFVPIPHRYWNVPNAECLHVLEGHKAAVTATAVTKLCDKVVSGSLDSTVKVWNTDRLSRYTEMYC